MLAAALTFAATLSLASCGTSNSEDSVGQTPAPPSQTAESQSAGRELSMALSVDPDGLDPQRTTAASTFQITNNLYDTLLRVNTDGSLREGLAQKWEVSEDGLTLTFHLRPDVRFHNGDICDAQAVVASFQRLKEEESPRAADYANYTFSVQDADTVVVTCEALDVAALSNFAYPWSAVVDVKAADTLKNQPVGTGPYRLQEWVPQQSLTLAKNPDYGQKIGSHYPTVLKEYVDMNDRYPYDPEKAKELLSQAGYQDGLTLEMYLPKSYPAYVSAGQVIADSLKEVGITCNITIVEWAAWLSDVYNGRNYDLTVVGHTGRLDPYVLLARYQSDSSENYFNYSNEEVDQLLADYKSETDEDKRTEIVQRVQEILAQDVPAYYIQDPITIYVTDSAVTGFQLYPIDIYELKDISLGQ